MARIAIVASFTPPVVDPAAPPTNMIADRKEHGCRVDLAERHVANPAVRTDALW